MALNNNPDVEQLKQQQSKLVVRVDQDSDSDLQALFDSVLKPDSKRPLQVPLRMRKLPNSFFNPPSTGSKSPSVSHSRENSADSAFGSAGGGGGGSGGGVGSAGTAGGGLPVAHTRAHSSPASLQQTYAAGAPQAAAVAAAQHIKQRSYDVVSAVAEEQGPLPPGWEQARTPEGQVYYLNHVTRTTTWEDPRKTLAAQAAVAAAQHQNAEQLLGSHTTAAQVSSQSATTGNKTATDSLGPLPDGWEQAATPEGEIYFINHQTRTTSWFDPRIPMHLQRSPGAGTMIQQTWSNVNSLQTQDQNSLQACQQKLRLQSLKLEREMLKQRQQEIRRQELMLRQPSSDLPMDPFLSGLADHSRQESADSGLGMGTTYSMPHTPEDFLANIEDNMDCVSEGGVGTSIDTPDLSSLNDNVDNTDDLVPSLQLGEEFSSDILDDVQSLINPNTTKPDNVLTWL